MFHRLLWLVCLLHFPCVFYVHAGVRLAWNDESCLVRAAFENLTDSAVVSSAESKPGREPSQVRLSRNGWCPKEQIFAMSHIYIEVTFGSLVNIKSIEINGIEDSSGLSYLVEKYMIDYQRSTESSDWLRYTTSDNEEYLKAGRRSYAEFEPPILARRLRFIPISENPTEICVKFELFGCSYSDGVISYEIPMPMEKFDDTIYDGPRRSTTQLQNGVGLLVDGELGTNSGFTFTDITMSQAKNWVGWSSQSQHRRPVEMAFKFDSLRNFSSCRIFMLTLRENAIFAAASANFSFSQPNARAERDVPLASRTTNQNGERWYEYTFTRPRVASEVRVSLSFGGPVTSVVYLLVSEVQFDSVPIEPVLKVTTVRSTRRPLFTATVTNATSATESVLPETAGTWKPSASRKLVTKKSRPSTQLPNVDDGSLELSSTLSWAGNTTLPLKQAVGSQSGMLLPVIVGVVLGLLAVCAATVAVLTRRYCCDKRYRYWSARHRRAGKASQARNGNGSGSASLVQDGAKPTIIANPLSAPESNKFTGLDEAPRLMLLQNSAAQPNGTLFSFNLAHSAPKVASQRFENASYVSLPPEDNRSLTTRTNSIVAVPLNLPPPDSGNSDLNATYLSQFPVDPFAPQFTNFNTVNMNAMLMLSRENPANQQPFFTVGRPLLGSKHGDASGCLTHSARPSEAAGSMTVARGTRKRKHEPRAHGVHHRKQTQPCVPSESGVRSSSSLSNQSASPGAATQPKHEPLYPAYDPPASSYNTMSSVGVAVGVTDGVVNSALDRFRLQGAFGSCRLRCPPEINLDSLKGATFTLPRFRLDNLKFVEKLGDGAFGEMYVCEMHYVETDLDSAVSNSTSNNASGESGHSSLSHADNKSGQPRLCVAKLLRSALTGQLPPNATHRTVVMELDSEIAALSLVSDPNLLKMTHVVVEDDTNFDTRLGFVLEYPSDMTLFDYVRIAANERLSKKRSSPTPSFTMHVAMQIASGMKQLEAANIAHCDLAARNCIITAQCMVKICDWSIASKAFDKHYYVLDLGESLKVRLPLRWMSWEALLRGRFSTRSDIWSFGVTIWELLTDCNQMPFAELDDDQVIENLNLMHTYHEANEPYFPSLSKRYNTNSRFSTCSDDVRSADETGRYRHLSCPTHCPRELYDLMRECWNREEANRPSFREIHLFLQRKCMGYDPKDDTLVHLAKTN